MEGPFKKQDGQNDLAVYFTRLLENCENNTNVASMSKDLSFWYDNNWGKIVYLLNDTVKHSGIKSEILLRNTNRFHEQVLHEHDMNNNDISLEYIKTEIIKQKHTIKKFSDSIQNIDITHKYENEIDEFGESNIKHLDKQEMELEIQKRKEKDTTYAIDKLIKICNQEIQTIEFGKLNDEWLMLNEFIKSYDSNLFIANEHLLENLMEEKSGLTLQQQEIKKIKMENAKNDNKLISTTTPGKVSDSNAGKDIRIINLNSKIVVSDGNGGIVIAGEIDVAVRFINGIDSIVQGYYDHG